MMYINSYNMKIYIKVEVVLSTLHSEKFSDTNDTFKQVFGILVNWLISTGILTKIAQAIFVRIPVLKCVNLLGFQWLAQKGHWCRSIFLSAYNSSRKLSAPNHCFSSPEILFYSLSKFFFYSLSKFFSFVLSAQKSLLSDLARV